MEGIFKYDPVSFDEAASCAVILDQSRLPWEKSFLRIDTAEGMYDAIRQLKVRGAPAIGIAAAFGLYAVALKADDESLRDTFFEASALLRSSRPTAVNLSHALNRMEACYREHGELPSGRIRVALRNEAFRIKEEDAAMCMSVAMNALPLIERSGLRILTHCNAGHLAVSRLGTALGPVYLAMAKGLSPKVYADETRPLFQGARLTAFELMEAGIDVTLICDNMASYVMGKGLVDVVLTGCDRIAANGDVANKIGTSSVAILARHYGIPFYVLGPSSTIDPACPDGSAVEIEQRDGAEVTSMYFARPVAPAGVKVLNPAFDITPAEMITAIITERGVFYPPYDFTGRRDG